MTDIAEIKEEIDVSALARETGRALAAAREERNIDIRDAARQLRLTSTVLRDLERGDLAKLGAPIYAWGYLRQYAGMLDVDAQPLLTELNRPDPEGPALPKLMRPRRRFATFDRYLRAATYVAGTSLLVVPIYWFIESGGVDSLQLGGATDAAVELTLPTRDGDDAGVEPTLATMAPFRSAARDRSSRLSAELTDPSGRLDDNPPLIPISGLHDSIVPPLAPRSLESANE